MVSQMGTWVMNLFTRTHIDWEEFLNVYSSNWTLHCPSIQLIDYKKIVIGGLLSKTREFRILGCLCEQIGDYTSSIYDGKILKCTYSRKKNGTLVGALRSENFAFYCGWSRKAAFCRILEDHFHFQQKVLPSWFHVEFMVNRKKNHSTLPTFYIWSFI